MYDKINFLECTLALENIMRFIYYVCVYNFTVKLTLSFLLSFITIFKLALNNLKF